MTDDSKKAELTERLGYTFTNPQLLQEALTHPSLTGPQNRSNKKGDAAPYERMEFLGDRVLGLVIAEWLYTLFPNANEGELAKRHAALVNRDALHEIALDIRLDRHLRLARGESVQAARKNLAALSDAVEALIGAMYLDGGLEVARRFIQRYWRTHASSAAPSDPKTALQEWAQGQGLPLPAYRVVERSGPAHAPKFIIEASVKGYPPAMAEGESKRAAEKLAAGLLLKGIPVAT